MAATNQNEVCKLTNRELQVLKLIVEGKTNTIIADNLNISPLTVKTHRQKLLAKFEASNTAQLIARAHLKQLL